MLNLVSVDKKSKRLNSGEVMTYLPVPELNYDELKKDYKYASHLKEVDQIDFSVASDGLYLTGKNIYDSFKAVIYAIKKIEKDFDKRNSPIMIPSNLLEEDDEDEDEDELEFEEEDEDEEDEDNEVLSLLYDNDSLKKVPIINISDFSSATNVMGPRPNVIGNHGMAYEESKDNKKPYWYNGEFPLIILSNSPPPMSIIEILRAENRYLFFINPGNVRAPYFWNKPMFNNDMMSQFEKRLYFELDFEACKLTEPSNKYYLQVLKDSVKKKGYKLSRNIGQNELIDNLKNYRAHEFKSSLDIERMVSKAIKKKTDTTKTLKKSDFEKVLLIHKEIEIEEKEKRDVSKELDNLVGLTEVKAQLERLVKRIKHHKLRMRKGYTTEDVHMSAVFMGNPGTAKTTVARYLGERLCEEKLLDNPNFAELGRKDLIGLYVGWTAPTVAKIFEENKGGTIFIDEAYSLVDDLGGKSFAQEAISEIIRQMENNPDTLVIFAGYTEKMKDFIKNANPGLRSRLTNVIEFPDYSNEEMFEIFCSFVTHEDYVLEDKEKTKEIILKFLDKINKLGSENLGNGRLMRKTFKSAVGFMSEREDNDLQTINVWDVQNAVKEIERTEKMVSGEKEGKIGF
ncbi:AAA family ATPase [Natranaerofaba carboxydovora]|uniref:AAA family ATPase n=1 Tax=Natranaerofaba carboxydovora TaxID=2742683 RepID=UPI001F144FC8|nr:AAA family ATPase [Natranaerofaba carboxydovora]UMZ73014.1 Stage V sporulation protein K [Natranaerofaba carboxydovora]